MDSQHASLETLQDIRRIMDRSSRFLSLSGLSGVSAGVVALIGAYLANEWIYEYFAGAGPYGRTGEEYERLEYSLLALALGVFFLSIAGAFFFTWRRAKRNKLPMWDHTSKKLLFNILIPLIAGGVFILGLLHYHDFRFIAPAALVFYGLALVNASKYTFGDVRYLGILEIILGLINIWYLGYGLYFWAAGFGTLHIVYGLIMWWKYEKSVSQESVGH